MMKKLYFLFTSILISSLGLNAQISIGNTSLDTLTVASGLSTPWEIIWAPDSSIWYTERVGKVSRVKNGNIITLLDYQNKVEQIGESGMLGMDILFAAAIPKVFLAYTYRTPNNSFYERLVRFDYDMVQDTLINEVIIQDSIQAAINHDGARVKIIGNHIYMTTGDAMNTAAPQDIQHLSGKVLRFDLNGDIPNDNPINGSPVYSWGHRNAQGLAHENGVLYSSEHGANTDDEINIIKKGRNYGWPDVEGFCNTTPEITFCNDSNVVEPLQNWTPTIATSDLIYYNHPAIPELQGSLLMTTLKNQSLYQLKLNSSKDSIINTNNYLTNYWGRLRDICTNPKGEIFIATNSGNNRIVKLFNPSYTGILTPEEMNGIRIYPIPSTSAITVELGQAYPNTKIFLYDSTGKLVHSRQTENKFISIDHELSPGIYFLEIKSNNKDFTKKIIIQ